MLLQRIYKMQNNDAMKEKIIQYIRTIYDPELGVNIYDLGMIYKLEVNEVAGGYGAEIEMTLTSFGCPMGEYLVKQVSDAKDMIEGLNEIKVDLVFDPPWNEYNLSYEAKLTLGML